MTESCFKELLKEEDSLLSDAEIWDFLVQLQLATEIKEPKSLFIPSLINSGNETFIRDQLKEFIMSDSSLGFHFSFGKCEKTSQLYSILLSKLANKGKGIYFEKVYCAKIENRPLGLVAGLCGSLKWKESVVDFLLLEYDFDDIKEDFQFARHKFVYF